MFCPTSFFSNQIQIDQFEKKSVRKNNVLVMVLYMSTTDALLRKIKNGLSSTVDYSYGGKTSILNLSKL